MKCYEELPVKRTKDIQAERKMEKQ